ncbi:hypothetical protein [Hymenobacter crusticola]|uniref:DUF4435 domain-containing protein n=1 Tax=Hymenobacter crusticola TaxID=1770526 RepID=A0A243W993_9BACT|nr:hypothetical protein [Hymenobacter crusticola]OUJ71980.1 hypothetical protein BXP70_20430 [Hymenobacter crusticola]
MLNTDYKRTPNELIARYTLEPSIKDIFVEGDSDRAIFVNYIKRRNLLYNVYTIDTIDTRDLKIISLGNIGHKNRVESLSSFFEEKLGIRKICLFCISDKDYDFFYEDTINNSYLLKTDFSSIESYSFNVEVMQKLINASFFKSAFLANEFIGKIIPAIKFLYLVRLVRYQMNYTWAKVEVEKAIEIDKKGNISFDLMGYILKLASRNHEVYSRQQEFIERYNGLEHICLNFDYRDSMHGHDYTALLNYYFQRLGREKVTVDFFEKTVIMNIEAEDLDHYPLFITLAQC